jgi:hypothetical protein
VVCEKNYTESVSMNVTFGALGGGLAGLYNRATEDDRGEPAV